MPVVEVPGMGDVEFPDDMSDDQIAAAIRKNLAAAPEAPEEKRSGLLANYFGGPLEPLASFGSGMLSTPVAGFAGLAQGAKNLIPGMEGMPAADRVAQVQEALTYQPRTDAGKATTGLIQYPFEKLAEFGDAAGEKIAVPGDPNRPLQMRIPGRGPVTAREYGDTGSPAMGALVNTGIQSLPALLLRGRSGAVAGDVSRPSPLGRPVASEAAPARGAAAAERPPGLANVPAPSKAELSKAADAAYKRADESGVVVRPESFEALKSKIVGELDGIDPTLHPDATAALKRVTDSSGELSLKKLETLRKIASDAEGSIKPADQRMAGKIVDEIDDYIDSLTETDVVAGDAAKGKALKEARNFYSRKKKADELDRLVERAELSAPNFSASGMENALRTEFRALAKNDRRMRRFTKEEQEAIKRVAKGGSVENVLRMLGKLAPTGVVSVALSSGAGFVTGGPIGAVALPALGSAARFGATRMTSRNARLANELVRRGPTPKENAPTGRTQSVAKALQR